MALTAIIALIIKYYFAHQFITIINTFVFSLISLVVGSIMLSTWSKKERTYNYKFGEDQNVINRDTELTSYEAKYKWDSLNNKFNKEDQNNGFGKSVVIVILLTMMAILAYTLTKIIQIKSDYLTKYNQSIHDNQKDIWLH